MDDFEVRAQSTTMLSSSSLVEELLAQAQKHRSFPVIVDGYPYTFHDVRGGYDDNADQHIVKLVQYHDNMANEGANDTQSAVYEIHLDDSFLLYADDYHFFDDEQELVVCIAVTEYTKREPSFREQLDRPLADISNEELALW